MRLLGATPRDLGLCCTPSAEVPTGLSRDATGCRIDCNLKAPGVCPDPAKARGCDFRDSQLIPAAIAVLQPTKVDRRLNHLDSRVIPGSRLVPVRHARDSARMALKPA